MLKTLRQHPQLVGMAHVLVDAVRHAAVVLAVVPVLEDLLRHVSAS